MGMSREINLPKEIILCKNAAKVQEHPCRIILDINDFRYINHNRREKYERLIQHPEWPYNCISFIKAILQNSCVKEYNVASYIYIEKDDTLIDLLNENNLVYTIR